MSKLYRQPVVVKLKDDLPAAFYWRQRWYQVTNCTVKRELPSRLQWWKEVGPPVYRCETRQGVACELILDNDDNWVLERIWD